VGNLTALVKHLEENPPSTGRVAVVGFCWGGGMAARLAAAAPSLDAGVVYYGPAPSPEEVRRIKANMMMHYAGLDDRVNAGVPAFEQGLKEAGVSYTAYMYPGANHAFSNDTAPARYNAEAAQLAWQRTIDFLKLTLSN